MTFKKKHKLGFLPKDDIPLDKLPLSIKLRTGVRDKVKMIPNWQDKLRNLIDGWVEAESEHD